MYIYIYIYILGASGYISCFPLPRPLQVQVERLHHPSAAAGSGREDRRWRAVTTGKRRVEPQNLEKHGKTIGKP